MSSVYLILSGLIIIFADYLTTPFIQKLYGSGISLEIVVKIRYSISVILSAIIFFLFLRFWKKRKQNLLQVKIISKCIFCYVILLLLLKTFFRSSVIITWAVNIISIPVNIFTCYYDFVLAFSTHPIAYIVFLLVIPFEGLQGIFLKVGGNALPVWIWINPNNVNMIGKTSVRLRYGLSVGFHYFPWIFAVRM